MTIANGLYKQVAIKVESAYGVPPGQSGAQLLRHVESTLDLNKDSYESQEKRTDFQAGDTRHGVRRAAGQLSGELSPKTYSDLFASILKRDFAAVTALTGVGITIAGSGPAYTVTRAAGSWLTDGAKVGDVIRLTTGTLNAANINKNLLIADVTSALVLSVLVVNGSTLVPEGPISGCGVSWPGKKTFVPQTGHTDKSFAVEHFFADISESELFTGVKYGKASMQLPPTGIATVSFDVQGKDLMETAAKRGGVATTAQYFTSPAALTSTSPLTSVNGIVRMAGATVAVLTGLTLDLESAMSGEPVSGSNTIPQMFPGKVTAKGNATAYFENVVLRDAFVNETDIDIVAIFTSDNSATADFITFVMPRVKLMSANKDDPESGVVQTLQFQALPNSAGGAGVKTEKTTISMQDSAA